MECTKWTVSPIEGTKGDIECSNGKSTIKGQCAMSDRGINDQTISIWCGRCLECMMGSGIADWFELGG